jgi:hypothetical protein
MGIAKKNSTLLVEFTHQLREQGYGLYRYEKVLGLFDYLKDVSPGFPIHSSAGSCYPPVKESLMIHENRELGYSVMEESLFVHHTSDLLHHLRVEEQRTEARHQLAQVSGITNESILNDLLEHDVTASTAAALPLVPLLLTAWADGAMEPAERNAIIKAMGDHGLIPSQPAYELLQSWINETPDSSLFGIWEIYARGIREAMDRASFREWKKRIMDRCEFIAATAGGFMGLGFTISAAEKSMLAKLESSFPL